MIGFVCVPPHLDPCCPVPSLEKFPGDRQTATGASADSQVFMASLVLAGATVNCSLMLCGGLWVDFFTLYFPSDGR